MDVLEAVEKFQLQALSSEWIENQWRSDFSCQDRELPTDYAMVLEDDDYSVLINNLTESIQGWMCEGDDESLANATTNSVVSIGGDWVHSRISAFSIVFWRLEQQGNSLFQDIHGSPSVQIPSKINWVEGPNGQAHELFE